MSALLSHSTDGKTFTPIAEAEITCDPSLTQLQTLTSSLTSDETDPDLDALLQCFRQALRDERDSWLELGRLCHEYILKRLKQGGTAHSSRCLISERLNRTADFQKEIECGRYIALWATVDLLGKGDPGGLTLSQIREFRKLVKCQQKTEKWFIIASCDVTARQLFRDARRQHWAREPIRKEVNKVYPGRLRKGRRVKEEWDSRANPIKAVITADPRDAAELLADLITHHEQHDRVVEELRKRLPNLFR